MFSGASVHESQVAGCLHSMGPTEMDSRLSNQPARNGCLLLLVLLHPPTSRAQAGLMQMGLTLSSLAGHEEVPVARVQHKGLSSAASVTINERRGKVVERRGDDAREVGNSRVAWRVVACGLRSFW